MLRNLPNNYTREMLLTLLNDKGFAGRFLVARAAEAKQSEGYGLGV